MTAQVCSTEAATKTGDIDLATATLTGTSPDAMSMVESAARVVSGCSIIGKARNALKAAGWTATIAANRITVGEEVLAQFIPAESGAYGLVNARWIIYSIAGTHPVWIVGGEQPDREDSSIGSSP